MLYHKKLELWLQPGGHADGNENLYEVACKELEEETGLREPRLLESRIFHLDRHIIPEYQGVPEHYHYDVRFLFQAHEDYHPQKNEESLDLAFFSFSEIQDMRTDASVRTMAQLASKNLRL